MKNKTNVQKGGNVTLYCNVSGIPTPIVSWTHVSTGKKWLNRTWVVLNVKVDDLGEYKCEASNIYENDSKSVFLYFPGKVCNTFLAQSFIMKHFERLLSSELQNNFP